MNVSYFKSIIKDVVKKVIKNLCQQIWPGSQDFVYSTFRDKKVSSKHFHPLKKIRLIENKIRNIPPNNVHVQTT